MTVKSHRLVLRLNHRGVALVTVLLVMLVLTILTTGVIAISMNNYKQSSTTVDHNQAFYVAEAGINYQVKLLEDKINSMIAAKMPTDDIDKGIDTWISASKNISLTLSIVNGIPSSFIVSADRPAKNIISISATGTVGTITRHLKKNINLTGFNMTNAILTSGNMNLTKLEVIGAPVQTLSKAANNVFVSGGTTHTQVDPIRIPTPAPGKTFLNTMSSCSKTLSTTTVTGGICKKDALTSITIIYDDSIEKLPSVEVPDKPTETNKLAQSSIVDISGNIEISSKTASPSTTYNLDTSNTPNKVFYAPNIKISGTVPNFAINIDSNITIVTDTLDLGGSFAITGTGTLTIFVPLGNGKTTGFLNNCPNNGPCGVKGDPIEAIANKFIVIVTGSSGTFTFTQTGGGSIYLSLLTKLNMSLDLGGTGSFNGFIATAGSSVNIQGTGNCNALIYAPLANIITKGTGDVTGALIGKTFVNQSSNPPTITYYDFSPFVPFGFLSPYTSIGFNPTVEK